MQLRRNWQRGLLDEMYIHITRIYSPTDADQFTPESSIPLMEILLGCYCYMHNILMLTSHVNPHCFWQQGPAPLGLDAFNHLLNSHTDRELTSTPLSSEGSLTSFQWDTITLS